MWTLNFLNQRTSVLKNKLQIKYCISLPDDFGHLSLSIRPTVIRLWRNCRNGESEIKQPKRILKKTCNYGQAGGIYISPLSNNFGFTLKVLTARRKNLTNSVERNSWHQRAEPTAVDRRYFVILYMFKPAVWSVQGSYEWHYRLNNTLWLLATWKHNRLYNLSEGLETRLYLLVLTALLRFAGDTLQDRDV